MARVSQAQAQENRDRVVETAARLFRERGVQGVSVADLMAEAGLTHGGFYKQFSSKEALVAEATGRAFGELGALLTGLDEQHPDDHAAARSALLDYYFSAEHRDHAGKGCPTTALGPDVAREAPGSPAREPYAEGVEGFARWMGDESEENLVAIATMAGALMLSRATAGSELSDRILAAARRSLSSGDGRSAD
ncbi:TetR/AcrR family transcriptional regulator [Actinoplanes friuliensis]|jgi:TetR/AcrR family transcriptional repressor of nem operon|uniref:Transcriptional regulator, TetR family protein n=1 Tax=Actinoplanes friuliensis DSM 7358 TaxID=1246995 RepID=U5W2P2_9ACTN|nr:TetR family transcriptional regulator [Actinoplanes friuliensis]AGZ42250.1 Transcriptional regulator, TetR family protein [Actinoplanes friuliensis DSM 7358]